MWTFAPTASGGDKRVLRNGWTLRLILLRRNQQRIGCHSELGDHEELVEPVFYG